MSLQHIICTYAPCFCICNTYISTCIGKDRKARTRESMSAGMLNEVIGIITLINKHPSLVASDPLRKTRPPPRRTLMQKCLKTSPKCLQKPPRSDQNETLDAPWSLPGGKPPQVGEIPSQRDTFRRPMCPTGGPMGPQNPQKSPKSSPKCLLKRYFAQLPTMHQKMANLRYPKNLENGAIA